MGSPLTRSRICESSFPARWADARVVFSRSLKASFTAGASSTMKTRCSPSGMGANSCRMPSRESFSSMTWRMVSYSGSAVNSDRSSFAHSATLRPGSAPPSIASSPRARLNADASRSPLAIMAASPASWPMRIIQSTSFSPESSPKSFVMLLVPSSWWDRLSQSLSENREGGVNPPS